MKVKKAWCFFEQSGTFRDKFKELGIEAVDCDIQNQYGKTDYQINLFKEIRKAYEGEKSIFDNIDTDDLIFAFYPCVRLSMQINLEFLQLAPHYKSKQLSQRLEYARKLEHERAELWDDLCKFLIIVAERKLKLIIENPYSEEHYLTRYFFIKPAIIDYNRRERGDFFVKPTQYFFIGCEPSYNTDALFKPMIMQKNYKRIENIPSSSKERSEISPEYAEQFIEEFIL